MNDKLRYAYEKVGGHMEEIIECFKPGAKITVLVRRPGDPEADFMMTDDDPQEAISMIQRRIAQS